MPAGTITLTNNSTAVTGAGTSFTTELKPNDFLVAVVGGVTYTLGVNSITSNTALVLKTAYNGPSTTGLAWTPIPNGALVGITAQVAADVAKAIRGLNLDKANWQQVYSGTGNITVNLPDGSSYTGPSWGNITTLLGGKANSSDLGDSATRNVGKTSGTVAAGNDSRFSSVDGMSGGTISTTVTMPGIELISGVPYIDFHYGSSTDDFTSRLYMPDSVALSLNGRMFDAMYSYRSRRGITGTALTVNPWNFYWSGTGLEAWVASSQVGTVAFTSSDRRIKEDIEYINTPNDDLAAVLSWKPVNYRLAKRGPVDRSSIKRGFIAQDLQELTPLTVLGEVKEGDENLPAAEVVDILSLDQMALISYMQGAIQAQQKMIDDQVTLLTELQNRMKALDGLDA